MRYLSKREIKKLQSKLPKGYNIDKKDEIKINENIIYKDNNKFLIIDNDSILPHLNSINDEHYQSVYIDKGAIPFLLKGADIMRPGITKIDQNIERNDIVIVKDENHNKNLAIGFSLFDSKELKEQKKGKSIQVYHYFNDTLF